MMLTPVTEAKSASDQLRDSRSSRIAAPADSRLNAALRPYPDTTYGARPVLPYTFLSPSLANHMLLVIRFRIRFDTKEADRWVTRAQSTRRCGSDTPTTTAATAPPRRVPTNSRPPKRGCNACADARLRSSDCAQSTQWRTGKNTASGPA